MLRYYLGVESKATWDWVHMPRLDAAGLTVEYGKQQLPQI